MNSERVATISKKAREKTGMSKVEFAHLFGKSPGAVTAWENGDVRDRDTYEMIRLLAETKKNLPSKQDLKRYRTFAPTGRYFMLYHLLKVLFGEEPQEELQENQESQELQEEFQKFEEELQKEPHQKEE